MCAAQLLLIELHPDDGLEPLVLLYIQSEDQQLRALCSSAATTQL